MLISDLSSEQLLMLIVPALPNMWALKHAMYHDFPTTQEKYRWMMACVFVPCLAGVAYYFVGRKHASKEKVDIRARIEAERARAAGEKAKAEEVVADAAEGVSAAEPVMEDASCASSDRAFPASAGEMADGSFVSADGMRREEASSSAGTHPEQSSEASVPRVHRSAGGDEWSFGCPDEGGKPKA